MSFLKKMFAGTPAPATLASYAFTVQCQRCGELLAGHINLNNDLSAEYEGDATIYHVRKVLMGSGRCFQQIEVELTFDSAREVLDRQVHGGQFVEGS